MTIDALLARAAERGWANAAHIAEMIDATRKPHGNGGDVIERITELEADKALLLKACMTFAEWLRREDEGSAGQPWVGERDTPEGELLWRGWYAENLRLCDLAQTQVIAALAALEAKP